MGKEFSELPVASSLSANDELAIVQGGLTKRVAYGTAFSSMEDRAQEVAVSYVALTSQSIQDQINSFDGTALALAVTSVQALVSKTSVALRDDVVSLRDSLSVTNVALTSVQALVSKTSVALRDDVVSLRDSLSVTNVALTSVQALVSKTSVALRDDIVSLRDSLSVTNVALTSVQALVSKTSVALRDSLSATNTALTSVQALVSKTSVALKNELNSSVARIDSDNNFNSNKILGYTVDVETTSGSFTFASADSGKVFVMTNGTSAFLNLNKAMPLGWNTTLVQLGAGTVVVSAQASTSLVNTSVHTKLNNYGSAAGLVVIKQEGSNSHAWYLFQGETEA